MYKKVLQNVHGIITECTSYYHEMYKKVLQNVHGIITECTLLLQNVQVIMFKLLCLLLQNVQEPKLSDFVKLKWGRVG